MPNKSLEEIVRDTWASFNTPATYVSRSGEYGVPGGGPPPSYQQGLDEQEAERRAGGSSMPSFNVPSNGGGGVGGGPYANLAGGVGGGLGAVPGWQYDIGDPLGSLRTYMYQQGRPYYNPFNPAGERMLARVAAGLVPQFYGKLLSQPSADYASMGQTFGDIIGEVMSGTRGPLGMHQTAGILGDINSLLRQTTRLFGPGQDFNLSTPEGRQAALDAATKQGGLGGLSVPQIAMAGQLSQEGALSNLFQTSYAPILGPALTRGLNKIVTPLEQMWENIYGPMAPFDVGSKYMSLLDMLTGSLGL